MLLYEQKNICRKKAKKTSTVPCRLKSKKANNKNNTQFDRKKRLINKMGILQKRNVQSIQRRYQCTSKNDENDGNTNNALTKKEKIYN